jgi:inositol transport system substrate-binding protein
MSKKLIILTLVLFLGAAVFSSQVGAQDKTVGVLIGNFSDQFQAYIMDGLRDAAEEYPDIEFMYNDAKFEASTQMNQAENLIVRGVDTVIMIPVDASASNAAAQRIVDAGIPLITLNSRIKDQELAVTYVGSDTVESGEFLMKEMANRLDGEGRIAVIQGQMGHEAQVLRMEGINNILDEYPDIEVVANQSAEWFRDEGVNVTENILQSVQDLDAIIAHNDEMAIGAYIAAKDMGKADDLLIAGIDATPEALDYIEEGKLAYSVFQDAKGQGRAAIHAAADLLSGEKLPEQIMVPYELVRKDEVDEYRAKYE